MIHYYEFVRETCHDAGTGPLKMDGAVKGYRSFGDVVRDGERFAYTIMGCFPYMDWESGIGSLDSQGRLARLEVRASSKSGAHVDFDSREKHVALVTERSI